MSYKQQENVANQNSLKVHKTATLGILAAISIVLMVFIRTPLFVPFLEYDAADIPILIGTLIYGPASGFALTLIVSAIQAATISSSSGIIGFIMHVLATGAMVIITGNIYNRSKKSTVSLIVSLAAGAVVMIGVTAAANLIFIPLFQKGMTLEAVKAMIVPVILPFNTIKALINCTVSFILANGLQKAGIINN